MNFSKQTIIATLLLLLLLPGKMLSAQSADSLSPEQMQQAAMEQYLASMPAQDMQQVKICYLPAYNGIVVIDSIDCAIDFLVPDPMDPTSMKLMGRYVTDECRGRHDVRNIMRPQSVQVLHNSMIFFLASSIKDSSYVGILTPTAEGELECLCTAGMNAPAQTFTISNNGVVVVGTNQLGYDFNFLDIAMDPANPGKLVMKSTCRYHYHVPKQSERIQASDPVGIGLTVVAVVVVFFALLIIALILLGYGNIIMKVQNRKAAKVDPHAEKVTRKTAVSGEVYAAIAAALYLYDEDLHDDEDGVLTIQKVERAWTPWNAKFYNMNQYNPRKK